MEMIEHILRKSHTISKSGFECWSKKAFIDDNGKERKKYARMENFVLPITKLKSALNRKHLYYYCFVFNAIQCELCDRLNDGSLNTWMLTRVSVCVCIRYMGDMIADAITNLLKSMKTNKIIHLPNWPNSCRHTSFIGAVISGYDLVLRKWIIKRPLWLNIIKLQVINTAPIPHVRIKTNATMAAAAATVHVSQIAVYTAA